MAAQIAAWTKLCALLTLPDFAPPKLERA